MFLFLLLLLLLLVDCGIVLPQANAEASEISLHCTVSKCVEQEVLIHALRVFFYIQVHTVLISSLRAGQSICCSEGVKPCP